MNAGVADFTASKKNLKYFFYRQRRWEQYSWPGRSGNKILKNVDFQFFLLSSNAVVLNLLVLAYSKCTSFAYSQIMIVHLCKPPNLKFHPNVLVFGLFLILHTNFELPAYTLWTENLWTPALMYFSFDLWITLILTFSY